MHKIYMCKYFAIWSKYTHACVHTSIFKRYARLLQASCILTADMLIEKQRRQLPSYFLHWLALGLSHETNIWTKQRPREWWTNVVR